jgi:hypothetical protein
LRFGYAVLSGIRFCFAGIRASQIIFHAVVSAVQISHGVFHVVLCAGFMHMVYGVTAVSVMFNMC